MLGCFERRARGIAIGTRGGKKNGDRSVRVMHVVRRRLARLDECGQYVQEKVLCGHVTGLDAARRMGLRL